MKIKITFLFALITFSAALQAQETKISNAYDGVKWEEVITYEKMFKDLSWKSDPELVSHRLNLISEALKSNSLKPEQKELFNSYKVKMLEFHVRIVDRSLNNREAVLADADMENKRVEKLKLQKENSLQEIKNIKIK